MNDAFNAQNLMTDPYTLPSERGFELQVQLTWSQPHPQAQVQQWLEGMNGFRVEYYGAPQEVQTESRTVELRQTLNEVTPDTLGTLLEQLRPLLERVRTAELGRRGFLRNERSTDYVPWKKNVVLGKDDLKQVTLEEGIKYVLE